MKYPTKSSRIWKVSRVTEAKSFPYYSGGRHTPKRTGHVLCLSKGQLFVITTIRFTGQWQVLNSISCPCEHSPVPRITFRVSHFSESLELHHLVFNNTMNVEPKRWCRGKQGEQDSVSCPETRCLTLHMIAENYQEQRRVCEKEWSNRNTCLGKRFRIVPKKVEHGAQAILLHELWGMCNQSCTKAVCGVGGSP